MINTAHPAVPATRHHDAEFRDIVARIGALPDVKRRFDGAIQAWKRAGLLPDQPSTDSILVASWEEWKAGATGINQHDGGDTPLGAIASARHNAARDVILRTEATSPAGVAIKLRCALDGVVSEPWASQALYDGDDTTLIARAEELCEEGNLIVDAIGFLTRRGPDRTEWDRALTQLADTKADAQRRGADRSLAQDEALGAAWVEAEDRLMSMPAPDLSAVLWKLDWLLHPETGATPEPAAEPIIADVRRLAGDALLANPAGWEEPHMGWLRSYQASRADLDALPGDVADDEPLFGRVNRLEAMILREPAHSKDAVLAKLFTAARVNADGGEPDTSLMQALVAEAEAAFGFGAQAVAS